MSLHLPLKWHGGKGAHNGKLAKWILSLIQLPSNACYVEPYFGGGSVLLHNQHYDGIAEVVSDKSKSLVTFWRVLREQLPALQQRLTLTPFAEDSLEQALDLIDLMAAADVPLDLGQQVEVAASLFVAVRQSRQALMKDFATQSTRLRGGMGESVSAYLSAIEGLGPVAQRLRRVTILNSDALEVIRKYDSPTTVFYLDPPYLHETRSDRDSYAHEMTAEQHEALLTRLQTIEGSFYLSGYASSMYEYYARRNGWKAHIMSVPLHSSSSSTKATKLEHLWTNFPRTEYTGPSKVVRIS
jgi:DNA adenine methylase